VSKDSFRHLVSYESSDTFSGWSKRGSEELAVGEGRFAEEWAEPVELEVVPLPCWKGLGV
jgi:hypothetical protein